MVKISRTDRWLEKSLQGLAFWIGHRQALYGHYPLPEGALVSEACNLIQANLPSDLLLYPECLYKNIANFSGEKSYFGRRRADLVVCDAEAKKIGRDGNVSDYVRYVIEVKRGSASKESIDEDLRRLHSLIEVSQARPRAFLFVVSESRCPTRFVKNGRSRSGFRDIPGINGRYKIRRTVKAAASFDKYSSAHYACAVEVFNLDD